MRYILQNIDNLAYPAVRHALYFSLVYKNAISFKQYKDVQTS